MLLVSLRKEKVTLNQKRMCDIIIILKMGHKTCIPTQTGARTITQIRQAKIYLSIHFPFLNFFLAIVH